MLIEANTNTSKGVGVFFSEPHTDPHFFFQFVCCSPALLSLYVGTHPCSLYAAHARMQFVSTEQSDDEPSGRQVVRRSKDKLVCVLPLSKKKKINLIVLLQNALYQRVFTAESFRCVEERCAIPPLISFMFLR